MQDKKRPGWVGRGALRTPGRLVLALPSAAPAYPRPLTPPTHPAHHPHDHPSPARIFGRDRAWGHIHPTLQTSDDTGEPCRPREREERETRGERDRDIYISGGDRETNIHTYEGRNALGGWRAKQAQAGCTMGFVARLEVGGQKECARTFATVGEDAFSRGPFRIFLCKLRGALPRQLSFDP